MLKRLLDQETGIISVLAAGLLSVAEIDENCSALRQMVEDRRQQGEAVRVMYDVTELQPLPRALEEYVIDKITNTFHGEDRCALLTKDAETKRHFRRLVRTSQIAVASSRLPAEMWLLYDAARPA